MGDELLALADPVGVALVVGLRPLVPRGRIVVLRVAGAGPAAVLRIVGGGRRPGLVVALVGGRVVPGPVRGSGAVLRRRRVRRQRLVPVGLVRAGIDLGVGAGRVGRRRPRTRRRLRGSGRSPGGAARTQERRRSPGQRTARRTRPGRRNRPGRNRARSRTRPAADTAAPAGSRRPPRTRARRCSTRAGPPRPAVRRPGRPARSPRWAGGHRCSCETAVRAAAAARAAPAARRPQAGAASALRRFRSSWSASPRARPPESLSSGRSVTAAQRVVPVQSFVVRRPRRSHGRRRGRPQGGHPCAGRAGNGSRLDPPGQRLGTPRPPGSRGPVLSRRRRSQDAPNHDRIAVNRGASQIRRSIH